MRRHRFQPGRLTAGLVVLGTALAYGLDAAGEWDLPPFAPLPVLLGGLCLAGLVSALAFGARRRRSRLSEHTAPPLRDLPMDELRRRYEAPPAGRGSGGDDRDVREDREAAS
ncbi:hypothetical protein B7755_025850 [Streptomyces sp. NBS 14/10]|uniref:hypothetical protein n=1 Tax=Streptomyces sp. NBS 14/10 TaxID=1945643 RepID=UPI00211B60FA|nr:hypothetical protein [Streptomyces sp. NBS 14/10]KAK1181258.1 hypothetical protein B7755_025850 [Streptomyces sp. NBS 14/10]